MTPVSYSMGPAQDLYRDLDEQILALTRQQERLVLTNPSRPRLLSFAAGTPRPESFMAVALRHENLFFGSLWVAYDQPHQFSEEEVRFLVTLGSQAALAAANARLFRTAEIGRQRLAAILASTPDPVLVTDQHDRLLLANPAAWQVLGLSTGRRAHPSKKSSHRTSWWTCCAPQRTKNSRWNFLCQGERCIWQPPPRCSPTANGLGGCVSCAMSRT